MNMAIEPHPGDWSGSERWFGKGRFGMVPLDVMAVLATLPGECIRVYIALTIFASRESGVCWPGAGTISRTSGVTKRNVWKAIAKLEKCGLLIVQRTGADKKSNVYTLILPPTQTPGVATHTGVASALEEVVVSTPVPSGQGTTTQWPGDHYPVVSTPLPVVKRPL